MSDMTETTKSKFTPREGIMLAFGTAVFDTLFVHFRGVQMGFTENEARELAMKVAVDAADAFREKPDVKKLSDVHKEVCLGGVNPAACPDRPECGCNDEA